MSYLNDINRAVSIRGDFDMQTYLDHLDAIMEAFEQGQSYVLLVTNEAMVPLFIAHKTHVRLVPNTKPLGYGTIVFYQRFSQSCSIRWIHRISAQNVRVRGVQQRHSEKIPRSSILAIVDAFEWQGRWVQSNSFLGYGLRFIYSVVGLFVRLYRHILAFLGII